jgi:hypothetical protein
VAGDFVAKRWKSFSGFASEPEVRPQLERSLVEQYPKNAARRFALKSRPCVDPGGGRLAITRFQLHVAQNAIAVKNDIISIPVHFGSKDLDIPPAAQPEHPQEIGDKGMFDDFSRRLDSA